MDARTLIHRAFYTPYERGEYQNCRVSFAQYGDEVRIYSYSTVVARVVNGRYGNKYTLVSDEGYSTTTRKHISWITNASPHMVIYVPTCVDSISNQFVNLLNGYKSGHGYSKPIEEFQHADHRNKFMHIIDMLDNYQHYVGDLNDECMNLRNSQYIMGLIALCSDLRERTCSRKEAFAKAEEFFLADEKAYKREQTRLKRKRLREQRAAIRKAEELRKQIEQDIQLIKADSEQISLRLLEEMFSWRGWNAMTDEQREQLRAVRRKLQMIQYNTTEGLRNASYMWVNKDDNHQCVETSQGVRVNLDVVQRLCKMWTNKQNILGENCGGYRVVANTDEYVKVGCHVIPRWNVELMCKELKVA